jgi:hypothetical protein
MVSIGGSTPVRGADAEPLSVSLIELLSKRSKIRHHEEQTERARCRFQ